MDAGLTLKIITPERIVLEKAVDEVTATAIDGEFSVLPKHEPLVSALAIDVLRYKAEGQEHFASIIGGMLEVSNEVVTVLSDAAELDTEIDVARAHQARDRAQAEQTQRVDKLDVHLKELALSRAMTRLKAVEQAKRRRGLH
jgi:F-type H+-transporting ATPase subunit epsilon